MDLAKTFLINPDDLQGITHLLGEDENLQKILAIENELFDTQELKLQGSTLKIDSSSVNSQDVCPLPLYEVANSPSCLMDTLTYTLAAPTSGCVRKGEGSLTFLNKNQLYSFRIEFTQIEERVQIDFDGSLKDDLYSTFVSLQFPAGSNDLDPMSMWRMWASKQTKHPNQAIKVVAPSTSTEVEEIRVVASNAVKITWRPQGKPVSLFLSICCLSTDFTNQKGVKGTPVILQVDTLCGTQKNRAIAKIKTFCDKGADRKFRQEDRRLSKFIPPYPCETSYPITNFIRLYPPFDDPFFFDPKDDNGKTPVCREAHEFNTHQGTFKQFKSRKAKFSSEEPFLYVRQEKKTEIDYTRLCLESPTLSALIVAISSKYKVEIHEVRRVFVQNLQNLTIHVDQDYVRALSGLFFVMKVLPIEDANLADQSPAEQPCPKYDIVLCEECVAHSCFC